MEIRVLGPIEVWDGDRPVEVGSPRQRALMAVLALQVGSVVSSDRLLDLVWGDDTPENALSSLRFHISKLRDALAPGRGRGDAGPIVTRAPGYVLTLEPDQVDAVRFEQIVEEAQGLTGSDPQQAITLIDDAMALWRGPALGEFAYEEFARSAVLRLEELRQRAVEDRAEASLRLGRHQELIGELRSQVDEAPLRERRWGQLMTALYRSGRQAEALDAFQQLRRRLGEDLGIEPSAELVVLEERILLQDPSLLEPGLRTEADQLRGYRLRDQLGQGAFGVVWRATQPGLGRDVAVKVIRPELANRSEFVRRFEAEARLVAALEHPHIVPLFDFWRDPDGAYLVMPYLSGGSLAAAIRERRFDATSGWPIIAEVGAALSFAHRHGVIHRDVSPTNVLLDTEDHAYLADLGIAVLMGDNGADPSPSPAYTAPEVADGEAATVGSDVFGLGALTAAVLTGTEPQPGVALPSATTNGMAAEVDEVLARATAADLTERFGDVDAFLDALAVSLGIHQSDVAAPAVRNPYKGLRAFDEMDADDFFGREAVVTELMDAVARHRLVGVVGPSGCGKSSVVRAGLLPALRGGALPGSTRWLITDLHPGTQPFAELEAALLRIAVTRPGDLTARLLGDSSEAVSVVDGLLPDRTELLLIVDQFEELFTLTTDVETRRCFLELLTTLANDLSSRVRIVITMRADFYDRPLDHPEFGDLLRTGLVSITAPSGDSLLRAITGPADAIGVTVEPGLDTEIVRDVADQPGGLPLMEYALTELFEQRRDGRLSLDAYHAGGGIHGALGRRADQLYTGYDQAGRDALRQVLFRLVAVEEGAADTRRRIPLTELHTLDLDHAAVDRVLDDFGRHRLVTFDRDPNTRAPTVEVAHEALLTHWERLRTWIDDRRSDLLIHRHLLSLMHEWEHADREPTYLLSGGRLDHYETFATTTDLALADAEHEFFTASRTREGDLQKRRHRRRQLILTGFAAIAAVAVVLAIVAFAAQQRAEDSLRVAEDATREAQESARRASDSENRALQSEERALESADSALKSEQEALAYARQADEAARVAHSRELALAAINRIDDDPELSLLLAVEAA